MKTPAIIASLTVAGSIAFAAGQQSGGKQSPPMPSGAQAHSMQEEMPQAANQATMACSEDPPLNWFTVVHDGRAADTCLNGNSYWAMQLRAHEYDVNRDGQMDGFFYGENFSSSESGDRPIMWRYTMQMKDGARPVVRQGVCSSTVLRQFMGTGSNWYCTALGLVDMDNDGDLDLIVILNDSFTVWIENTGFQHTTHLTGDLDGDGKVNGSDLGILLSNWQN
jgi:hypothetical protein